MTTTTEAERLLDLCLMTAYAARSAAAAQRAPCYEALLGELRRLAAVEAERDQLRAEAQNSHEAWVALSDHAEKQRAELEALRRGEFICGKCGLRKDADAAGPVPF